MMTENTTHHPDTNYGDIETLSISNRMQQDMLV